MYTILICDDDRDIVSALDIYLTSEGYRTIAAYNGREAIQAAEENEIHLILMDVMMPELDGIPGHGQAAGGEQCAHYPAYRQERGYRQDPGTEHRGGRLHYKALQSRWR